MLNRSLHLYYAFKIIELIALTFIVLMFVYQGIETMIALTSENYNYIENKESPKNIPLAVLIGIGCVLTIYQLLFNNLLMGMRFKVKKNCVTIGMCCFDCINIVQCEFCLVKICKDDLTSGITALKWVFKLAFFIVLAVLTGNAQKQIELENDTREMTLSVALIVIYAVHIPMFLLARIPIFILYKICCCCFCDDTEYIPDDPDADF